MKKAFREGEEVLFANFKNKLQIMSALKEVQLFRQSVTRKFEALVIDLNQKLRQYIAECKYFSL